MKKKVKHINKNEINIAYLFGFGLVGVGYGSIYDLGVLTLSDLKPDINRKVGDKIKKNDIKKNGNQTTLFFSKQKDVDDMIKRLKIIKSKMKKDSIKKGKKK